LKQSYADYIRNSEQYLQGLQEELPAQARFRVKVLESRDVRLALIGVFATFFTWGLAYVFEYINNPSWVNLAAFITFFAIGTTAVSLSFARSFFYRRLPRVKRSEISRIVTMEGAAELDFEVKIEGISRNGGLTIKCSPTRSDVDVVAQDAEVKPAKSILAPYAPQEPCYRCYKPSKDDDGLDVLKFASVPPPGVYELVVRYRTFSGADVFGSTHFQLEST